MSEEQQIKLFDKYDLSDLKPQDKTLQDAMSFKPVYIPHSGGRHEHQRFKKTTVNVIERLANIISLTPKAGGKKSRGLKAIEAALDIIHLKTNKNPLEVLLAAIENSAPREDTTRISYGGILYYQAVDISPVRRVDLALRNIIKGARKASFKNSKPFHECLAEEIMNAAEQNPKSFAISRKEELEKHALASR